MVVACLSLVASVVALGVSVWTTNRTVEAAADAVAGQIEAARLDAHLATFQRIHEALIDPVAASGRRLLFIAHGATGHGTEAASKSEYPAPGEPGWDEINYSLALYDTLGGYLHRGEVPREAVLSAWHHPLANIADAVADFMAWREREHRVTNQPWAYLGYLLAEAQDWTCNCPSATRAGSPG